MDIFLKGLMMKTLHKAFAIGATIFTFGTAAIPAVAQDTAPHKYAATKFDPAKMQERMDKRAQRLHDKLKITPAQEGAWQAYISAIKPDMTQRGHFDRAAFKEMPAPERMEKRLEMAKARIARMESHLAATRTFYAALTPEQQKAFDDKAGRMGHRRHGMMKHHQH